MKLKNTTYIALRLCLLFLAVLVTGCRGFKSNALTRTPPFSLKSASYQEWVAGVQSGAAGTNVTIIFNTFTDTVTIDSIYFRKKRVKAKQSANNPLEYTGYFKNEARDIIMDIDPASEAQNIPPEPFPFDLKDNQAVLSYLHYGKKRYYKVKELEQSPPLAYPAGGLKNDP